MKRKAIEVRPGLTRPEVYRYMQAQLLEHCDPQTNEVNHTALAEDAADHFDLYETHTEYRIPEWVFELALQADTKTR